MAIKGILFDKDGTLLDFNKSWIPRGKKAIGIIISKYALSATMQLPLEKAIGIFGTEVLCDSSLSSGTNKHVATDLYEAIKKNNPNFTIDFPEFLETSTTAFNYVGQESKMEPIENTYETLEALYNQGIKIGLSTADSTENAQDFLETNDLIKFFTYIGADDGLINPKPHRDYMDKFCQITGLSPLEVMVVGDTMVDINFGRNSNSGEIIGVLSGTSKKEDFPKDITVLESIGNIIPHLNK